MKCTGSRNSSRGHSVEKILADKYGGITVSNQGYDVELEDALLEVKSCLSWQFVKPGGKNYHAASRVLINIEKHEAIKQKAEEKNKRAIYAFVKIPRKKSGKIEKDPKEWTEAWVRWEYLDSVFKNPESRKVVKCKSKGYDERCYYRIPLKLIFGN